MQSDISLRPATSFMSRARSGVSRTGVLVVGAGPTGLALACDLLSRGIDVSIIDKAAGPASTSRAFGLQPRGAEILERLGALGDLPRRAVELYALTLFAGRRRLFRIEPPPPEVATPGVLLIGQAAIEGRLRTRLAELGVRVSWGTELASAEDCGTGLEVGLRTENETHLLRCDWLVGCDGAHSTTRKLAGIDFPGTSFSERFLLADVRLDWARPHNEAVVWVHADGVFAAMPLPGDVWRLMVELPAGDGQGFDRTRNPICPTAATELLQRLLKTRVGDAATRVSDPTWISNFRFHRRMASSYRRGKILIAGDAAHIHSPFGGQGMNTGLGDAYNLGWKLAMVQRGRADAKLIDTYEAERRPVAVDVLENTSARTNLLLGKGATTRLLRDCLFIPMLKVPMIQRKMAAHNTQLGVSYRDGPLARLSGPLARIARRFGASPRPGDRAPNAMCLLQPRGETTTLAAQTSAGWALLLFGGRSRDLSACASVTRHRLDADLRVLRIVPRGGAVAPIEANIADAVLEDSRGAIKRLYRARGTEAVLLRPDGHVACRTASPEAETLRNWLHEAMDRSVAPPRSTPRLVHRPAA